jgi:hypothetical protein
MLGDAHDAGLGDEVSRCPHAPADLRSVVFSQSVVDLVVAAHEAEGICGRSQIGGSTTVKLKGNETTDRRSAGAGSPVHTGPLRGIVMVAFAEDRAGIEVVIDFQGMVDYATGQHKH